MSWKRRKLARTTEALRAITTYMLGEPIIPTDGPFMGRLFLGDGSTVGGRPLRFAEDGAGIVAPLLKTANSVLAAGDAGRLVRCQGTLTLSLPAAASILPGWNVTLSNEGTGIVTIAPNGAEAIDGVAGPFLFLPKQKAILFNDGAGFRMIWQDREPILARQSVSASVAFVDIAIPDGWNDLEIRWSDIQQVGQAPPIFAQASIDGINVLSGSNDYRYVAISSRGPGEAASTDQVNGRPYIVVGGGGSGDGTSNWRAHSLMDVLLGDTKFGRIMARSAYNSAAGLCGEALTTGYCTTAGRWKKIRFYADSGNLTESTFTVQGRAR